MHTFYIGKRVRATCNPVLLCCYEFHYPFLLQIQMVHTQQNTTNYASIVRNGNPTNLYKHSIKLINNNNSNHKKIQHRAQYIQTLWIELTAIILIYKLHTRGKAYSIFKINRNCQFCEEIETETLEHHYSLMAS